jgi:non-ribosomal peptide synthetase component F
MLLSYGYLQPVKSIAMMCHKAQPRLLLASAKHEAIAQELKDILTLVIPRDISQSTSTEIQPETVQPHHTLYAGFTSGSTGEPKVRDGSYCKSLEQCTYSAVPPNLPLAI